MPVEQVPPWTPLTRITLRKASFSSYARCKGLFAAAIHASLTCWASVRSPGFFQIAYLAPFNAFAPALSPLLRAVFHTSRRTSSRASVAHFTTWNGSVSPASVMGPL